MLAIRQKCFYTQPRYKEGYYSFSTLYSMTGRSDLEDRLLTTAHQKKKTKTMTSSSGPPMTTAILFVVLRAILLQIYLHQRTTLYNLLTSSMTAHLFVVFRALILQNLPADRRFRHRSTTLLARGNNLSGASP